MSLICIKTKNSWPYQDNVYNAFYQTRIIITKTSINSGHIVCQVLWLVIATFLYWYMTPILKLFSKQKVKKCIYRRRPGPWNEEQGYCLCKTKINIKARLLIRKKTTDSRYIVFQDPVCDNTTISCWYQRLPLMCFWLK